MRTYRFEDFRDKVPFFVDKVKEIFEDVKDAIEKEAKRNAQSSQPTEDFVKPASNIVELKNGSRIEVAAPGLRKESFRLQLRGDKLIVSSQKPENEADFHYTQKEFNIKPLKRTFTISDKLDSSKIEAKYENGVLLIFIPYKDQAAANDIEISIG